MHCTSRVMLSPPRRQSASAPRSACQRRDTSTHHDEAQRLITARARTTGPKKMIMPAQN
nr:MAG TPA: hypothetical protein [Caudoviricetes sp.]